MQIGNVSSWSSLLSSTANALFGSSDSTVPWAETLSTAAANVFGDSAVDLSGLSSVFADTMSNYYAGLDNLAGQEALDRVNAAVAAQSAAGTDADTSADSGDSDSTIGTNLDLTV